MEASYEVIVVGGRPAGASLAARLGAAGVRTLVLDRAKLPSVPTVPSCPTIHPGTMRLLDELGLPEARYAHESGRIDQLWLDFGGHFVAKLQVPEMHGRRHFYGIDRQRFDQVLWEHLASYPSVERRDQVEVKDLLRGPDGRVQGVALESGEVRASLAVIGADGRYSLVARKADAQVTEEEDKTVSTVYYADWENLAPLGPGVERAASIYATGRGTNVLFLTAEQGRTTVITHQRADRVDIQGDAERYYLSEIQRYPGTQRRLAGAKRVSEVIGIKRVGNRYLQHAGPGWALTGDALHHKDPVDGQGIYDALVETKVLAEELLAVKAGTRTWEQAMARYAEGVRRETHGMYVATMQRLARELYDEPPVPVIKTLLRWMLNDPLYQRQFLRFLGRDIPSEGWLTPGLMAGAAARGLARDVRGLLGGSAQKQPA